MGRVGVGGGMVVGWGSVRCADNVQFNITLCIIHIHGLNYPNPNYEPYS